ncbi:SOS response-associated peptidase family protein [Allorhodopirellula solitaria]|uniref:Abasic site processing protein n=1 Tax=Allorhodopirellula solitaria TaxID=2527987 RepID=A0A5C5YEZ2_9BACT|nr:SOS response-associated peptidase family protein [Allorhodopirellula solitaria]TWT74287.1 hypothetical protein CA85_11740 [Allorhodopirellula solitaria]
MCNRYQLRTNMHSVCRELDVQPAFDFDLPDEVFPFSKAPVAVLNREGDRELRPMTFGMGKGGGRSSGRGPALNNTRIESREKWPWKKSFEKYRCVVPMTSFREPSYWGETEGTEVSFSATDDRLLLAAGIFSFRDGGGDDNAPAELSMSLIMRPALPFVMEHGHHRSPFFLRPGGVGAWLQRSARPPDESIEVLREYADDPPLVFQTDRQMAASWTKRRAAKLQSRDDQLAEIEQTGPLGID